MAGTTPHAHWGHYDESLEMASWDRLHSLVEIGTPVTAEAPDATRLADLARSAGYGEADGFVAAHGAEAGDDEPEHVAALRSSFEGYEDGDYFNCIDRSVNVLAAAFPGDDEVLAGARSVAQAMRDAYVAGREDRISNESSAPAP